MSKTIKAKKTTTVKAKKSAMKGTMDTHERMARARAARLPKSPKEKTIRTGIPILEEQNLYIDIDDLNLIIKKYYMQDNGEWGYHPQGYFPKTIVGFRYMLDRVVCEYAIENLDLLQIMERMDRMEETIKSINWEFK